jgi:RNA polymerase sigma-70 factor, ECF subfamily
VAVSVIESNERFADAWTNHHRFLLDVAYRLLGSYSDAEDLDQEAFSRLLRTDLDPIEDVRAWLVVVVSRLGLDQLRSARVKREAYIGPWFPEPLLFSDDAATDPLDVVTMEAPMVGRTVAACRQLASRARKRVEEEAGSARFAIDPVEQRRVVDAFIAARAGGDIKALLPLLDPSVMGWLTWAGRCPR